MSSDDRAQKLAQIMQQVKVCTACRLYQNTRNPVPGHGNINAEIIFIGEAPGEQEDIKGLPFVGRSGQYLDYLLNLIGMNRSQVFIANVVKHRPPNNRDPEPDEIIACKHFLDEQIGIIDPLLIVTLGRFSMARYFPDAKISAIHGKPKYDDRFAYYPLYHPAAALRNPGLRHDMEADIKRIPSILDEIRQKRRTTGIITPSADEEPPSDAPPKQLPLF